MWIVSHCNAGSLQDAYMKELQKYIPIDIFGKCTGKIVCPPKGNGNKICVTVNLNGYMFYISVENSICKDYVMGNGTAYLSNFQNLFISSTMYSSANAFGIISFLSEKLFTPLSKYIVPVVLAAKEVQDLAPPESYIDVFDFPSPKHLADYLLHLNRSWTEYLTYFMWKNSYNIRTNSVMFNGVFCEFCKYLYRNRNPSIIHNFTDWFFDKSGCYNNKVPLYLQ